MRQRALAAHVILSLISLILLTNIPREARAAGADSSLVLAALHVVETDYVKPVDAIKLLNAAVAGLRKATNQGPLVLPDIPGGVGEFQAVDTFRREFSQALKAGPVPETDLAYTATREMLASLHDSHVYYMDPTDFKQRQEQKSGTVKYAGMGVVIKAFKGDSEANEIFVTEVFPGSPAAAAGIRQFDKITGVNGTPVPPTASGSDVAGQTRGPEGSSVVVTIERGGQTLTVPVVRGPIQFSQVEARMLQPGVVYARLFSFSAGAGDQLRRLLKPLMAEGTIRAVILDLRGNWGGYLREAESVAGIFLPARTMLARVLQRTGGQTELVARGDELLPHVLLAVLMDSGTASSAEVVVGALKNAHRATSIGEKTAGALGSAREVSLPAGGMSVTISLVIGPQYEQIEGVGITPENQVKLSIADLERGVDTQLDAALNVSLPPDHSQRFTLSCGRERQSWWQQRRRHLDPGTATT